MKEADDKVIWRSELPKIANVTTQTLSRWKREKRLPEPDVFITQKSYGWRASTLRNAGISIC